MPEDTPFDALDAPGWLTANERRYLLGEKTYDDPAEDRRVRLRLRTRLQNGLKDFILLVRHLEPRDREQLLADVTAQLPREDDVYRQDELDGLVYAIAFCYLLADDLNLPFETVVEQGLRTAVHEPRSEYRAFLQVDVTIDQQTTVDPQAACGKIRAGESLTGPEYWRVVELILNHPERVVDLTNDVTVDVDTALETGESLTRTESLVIVGRGLADPSRVNLRSVAPILHEDVRDAFQLGLGTVDEDGDPA